MFFHDILNFSLVLLNNKKLLSYYQHFIKYFGSMTLKAKENKFGHFSNINLIVMRKHNSIFAWFKTLKVGSEPPYLLSLSFFFSGKFKVALKHLLRLPHS